MAPPQAIPKLGQMADAPGARSKFWGLSGSEDRGGGDNSIQFINFRRVGDKSFKEWRQKVGGWKGGWQYLDLFVLLYWIKMLLSVYFYTYLPVY